MTQATKPAPLGRGLSALFGDADASYQTKGIVMQGPQEKRGTQNIPTGALKPGPYQPRRNFNDEALKELAASVRERGILQPILVRPDKSVPGHYEIIAGERRWRAAQLAKLHEVPVVIRSLSDSEALEYGLIENVQRQDLTTLEEADGYQRLLDEFGHTQEGLSKIVGKSRSHVANILRLLSLPAEVKQLIESGQLSAGHARALVTAADPLALAREIVRRGLNVRQAEALAKAGMPAETASAPAKKSSADANITAFEKDLTFALGLKVHIASQGKSGTITLRYKDLDQFDALVKKLKS